MEEGQRGLIWFRPPRLLLHVGYDAMLDPLRELTIHYETARRAFPNIIVPLRQAVTHGRFLA